MGARLRTGQLALESLHKASFAAESRYLVNTLRLISCYHTLGSYLGATLSHRCLPCRSLASPDRRAWFPRRALVVVGFPAAAARCAPAFSCIDRGERARAELKLNPVQRDKPNPDSHTTATTATVTVAPLPWPRYRRQWPLVTLLAPTRRLRRRAP